MLQTGDAGGNTTALGIQGGVVPGTGPNSKTEVDTTIFKSKNAMTDGLGRTEGQGENTLDQMADVTTQSGSTLPQVSANNGSISGTLHVVTTDGAGPYTAVVDPTAQGAFSQGTKAEVTTQVPGKNGNIAPGPLSNNLLKRALWHAGIYKRALNVDQDFVSTALSLSPFCFPSRDSTDPLTLTFPSTSLSRSRFLLAPPAVAP